MHSHPGVGEIKKMIEFCKNHKKIYIYGCNYNQIKLSEYLLISGFELKGFIISDSEPDVDSSAAGNLKVYMLNELKDVEKSDIGIILGASDRYYNEIVQGLFNIGFGIESIFFMSEWNKGTIANSITPLSMDHFICEVAICDHCDLNCAGCSNFCNLSGESFLDLAVFERDMERLSKLIPHCGGFALIGGEPLLNPEITKYMGIARKYLPTTIINVITNGILLSNPKDLDFDEKFWRKCSELNIGIIVTKYPININHDIIERKAEQFNVNLRISVNIADPNDTVKTFAKFKLNPEKNVEPWQFISCFPFNRSNVLKDGKIFPCPMSAHIEHFNDYFDMNLKIEDNDYIDIFKAESYDEIASFLALPRPFCAYCDIANIKLVPWGVSKKTIEEYV